MLEDVVDVGANGGHHIDTDEVAGGPREAVVHRFTVDHEDLLAEARARKLAGKRLGLGIGHVEAVDDHETVLGLGRKRHLETERANLLVERLLEVTLARTMCLAAADEDRRSAVAMASRTAALLATPLLAGARDVGTLARRTSRAATILELPGNDTVQDVRARLEAEHVVRKLDVALGVGAVQIEDLDLHD